MGGREARYDRATDFYVGFARAWAADARPFLPADLSGRRVLDMACGLGELSRLMADRGASVTGVDLSSRMLGHASDEEAARPLGIRYLVGDVTTTDWWDGDPFDAVVCNMALMDVDDLDAVMAAAAEVLHPGGEFSYSLLHPCFPGLRTDAAEQLPSWPPDRGYAAEGWWTTGGDGVRGRVGATHRMLSTYLNATVRAGFTLEQFGEATAAVPRFLVVGCRRGA
ncbi:MAG TPA: class I SAM-dependent methyltransferase [Nocardioides sp.]|nr:class I SAM-dependent methyltransferase [Nocardioides sp.]